MKTIRLQTPSLALAMALGLSYAALTPVASAMEEVAVRATSTAKTEDRKQLEAEIASYIKAVELESKDAVKASLEQATAPRLYVALAVEAHRG